MPTRNKHTPNHQFREARARTASLTHPKEGLSRQELAELVNDWVWKHHRTELGFDRNYIGKIEQGVIRWPGTMCREALREILSVSADSELGFVNARARRQAVKLEEVDTAKRQKFIHTTVGGVSALLLAEPIAALLEDTTPDPIPRRVGASDIAQIRDATQTFESGSRAYGGGTAREAAMGELRWAAGLLDAICPDQLLPELHAAVGALAETVGYMALDAGAYAEAHRIFDLALACAEQAKDWNLRAKILSNMAAQAVWTGQPDDGLTLAEQALIRPDWLAPTVRAQLHNDRALALAAMRRVQEALRAIGTADEHFAHVTPDNEPSFMAGYTDARHALFTGRRLVDLAILGRDPGEATTRLTTAVAGFPEGRTRSRAICLTKLATLTMATGDPLQATAIGNEALEVASTLRSHRTTEDLRELFRHAAAHQDLEEVAELRHRIRTLVCTNHPENHSLDDSPGTQD
ncbi:MAG: XRE family transcriptional regulator [Pseudonocardiales bacterium]|nr:XRE family transcriptional regulator [Pseudonocardiales bacterium]